MAPYFPRTLETVIASASRSFPVVLVTGARQVGKTTMLQHAATPTRRYVTLDDPLLRALARQDPALFLQRYQPPVLIDEVQYAPELLPHIKMAVDAGRKGGMFWLTGSQQFHMMRGVSESLAGRVAVLELHAMSRAEVRRDGATVQPFHPVAEPLPVHAHSSLRDIFAGIWRGWYPALVGPVPPDRSLFYHSYVQTYLQRDIRDLARVGDERAFLRFLVGVAARTAQMLNLTDLARDADIAPNTAKSWLSLLESSGIVTLLQPWHVNRSSRIVKTPKLYMLDTGLAAWLTQWSSAETLEAGAMAGAMLETWVVAEIIKRRAAGSVAGDLFYYRDKERREIDLLIERDGVVHPIEIRKSASPRRDDIRHFDVLDRLGVRRGTGALLCLVRESLPLTERDWAHSVGVL
jgi:uncharacterized protein